MFSKTKRPATDFSGKQALIINFFPPLRQSSQPYLLFPASPFPLLIKEGKWGG
jgi:hypothetical protein